MSQVWTGGQHVVDWYREHARDLPWRTDDRTPWGVLVSEVMLQQTPVARVEPVWRQWMARWPDPGDLAACDVADVLRAWGTLGYPRRALRLHAAANQIVELHGGQVPDDEAGLAALPGVGAYTVAAVLAFAFGQRTVVLDTNVRRVLARALTGQALPAPHASTAEYATAQSLLPADDAPTLSVALMELGSLVCTARTPRCPECPLTSTCAWLDARCPPDAHAHRRRTQPWQGTDRQARGRVMAALREACAPVPVADLSWPDPTQLTRCVAALAADGLLVHDPVAATVRLPSNDDGPHE